MNQYERRKVIEKPTEAACATPEGRRAVEATFKAETAMSRDAALFGAATLINAAPANLVGSASGSVNWIIHVVEAVAE